jgi:hypothetical protein
VGAFVLTTPYAIFDFRGMLHGLNFDETHYSSGHVGAQGGALGANARWIFDSFGVFLLGLLGLWWVSARRQMIIVGAFVIAYFALLSSVVVRFERNLLPLVPALAVLVVVGGLAIWDRARVRWGTPATTGLSVVLVAALGWTLYGTAGELHNSLSDQKAQAFAWIQANVPAGDTVVLDPFSPYVDPSRWHVVVLPQRTVGGVTYPQWYVLENPPALHAAHPDVVVETNAGSGRYLALGSTIARQTQAYLEAASCARYAFDDNTIHVYVLRCGRPTAQRLPAPQAAG